MNATIETVTLNNVEVQCNGIIRNNKGRLIARLVNDIEYDGEHIIGTSINNDFYKKLRRLINEYSLENGSNTQDFILARYLANCLDNFNIAVSERDRLKK